MNCACCNTRPGPWAEFWILGFRVSTRGVIGFLLRANTACVVTFSLLSAQGLKCLVRGGSMKVSLAAVEFP